MIRLRFVLIVLLIGYMNLRVYARARNVRVYVGKNVRYFVRYMTQEILPYIVNKISGLALVRLL